MDNTAGCDFVDRIEILLRKQNIKRTVFAKSVGVTNQAFTDWRRRGTIPAADIALRIADALNADLRWLITGQEKSSENLSADERNMLNTYRLLDERDREELQAIAEVKLNLNMSRLGVGAKEEPSA